jgi:hypothetical protein
MRLLGGSLAIVALVLAVAGSAQAAQRYAAPAGSGEACTADSRCSLETAVEKAGAGDEVIVGAGTYTTSGSVTSPELPGIDIHGEGSGPMPVVEAKVNGWALELRGTAGTLSYIEVNNRVTESTAITCSDGWLVERVKAAAIGAYSTIGIQPFGTCQVRNSLARAEGEDSYGIYASGKEPGTLLSNVTAIAKGPDSIGIVSRRLGGAGTRTVTVRNSIASGDGGDLGPTSYFGEDGLISVFNSNFDSVAPGYEAGLTNAGGNQAAAPLFADVAAGDFREAPGSPTIGAGAVGSDLGPLDLAGNPRVVDGKVDIGAYQFLLPPGELATLKLKRKRFRAARGGQAVISAGKRKRKRPPVGTRVSFSLTNPGTVVFTVERRTVKKRKGKKRRVVFKRVKGSFSLDGTGGAGSFKFSGRVNGRALKPGGYRLVGTTGAVSRRAGFRIVR